MKRYIAGLLAVLAVVMLAWPLGAAAEGTITVNPDVRVDNGRVTVSWTDSGNNGPYSVIYEHYDGSSTKQARFWARDAEADSTTSATSMVLETLLPGHQYYVYVLGQGSALGVELITVPAAPAFEDGKLNASQIRVGVDFKCLRLNTNSTESLQALSSADIKQHIDDRAYGMRYEISLPQLAYARDYFVQIAMFAPNGYEQIVHCSQYEFSTGKGFTHYLKLLGASFFDNLYSVTGDVPAGTYRVELYFNGMLAHTKSFTVR